MNKAITTLASAALLAAGTVAASAITITLKSGGMNVQEGASITYASAYTISGGALTVYGTLGTTTIDLSGDGSITVYDGGTITAETTTIAGEATVSVESGGSFTSTDELTISGGSITVDGTLTAGTLAIVVGDSTDTAVISGSGTVNADTLAISLSDEYIAALVAGTATEYSFEILADTLNVELSAGATILSTADADVTITYSNGTLTISSVPEPSAFGVLAGVGALAFVAARRRRSRKA